MGQSNTAKPEKHNDGENPIKAEKAMIDKKTVRKVVKRSDRITNDGHRVQMT